jgi:hypothetical protein
MQAPIDRGGSLSYEEGWQSVSQRLDEQEFIELLGLGSDLCR